ncbi:hypothetical protein AGLY_012157 [Aphis glycines]|uniref:Uncharacterized protein n=1 Tax=Aphis glycines TaxID=307491 RepID=A0A6G0TA69_APHGL|nr:hypothetical protein AGLY_012157 [Aphis glycines]
MTYSHTHKIYKKFHKNRLSRFGGVRPLPLILWAWYNKLLKTNLSHIRSNDSRHFWSDIVMSFEYCLNLLPHRPRRHPSTIGHLDTTSLSLRALLVMKSLYVCILHVSICVCRYTHKRVLKGHHTYMICLHLIINIIYLRPVELIACALSALILQLHSDAWKMKITNYGVVFRNIYEEYKKNLILIVIILTNQILAKRSYLVEFGLLLEMNTNTGIDNIIVA